MGNIVGFILLTSRCFHTEGLAEEYLCIVYQLCYVIMFLKSYVIRGEPIAINRAQIQTP